MNKQTLRSYFLLVLLLGSSLLLGMVFKPFLYAIILAAVFAIVFEPMNKKLLQRFKGNEILAALITTTTIIIILVVPVTILGIQIFHEGKGLYRTLADDADIITNALARLQEVFPFLGPLSFDVHALAAQVSEWIVGNISGIFSNLVHLVTSAFIFMIALYYLLKDGIRMKHAFITVSPLHNTSDEVIFQKLKLAINSVMKGNLIVAAAQGVLAGIGFVIFGIPNVALWGTATMVAALIPGIGTAIIMAPAVAFLYISGKTGAALGLLLWATIAVGLVDNFLRPKLIGRQTQIHPLFVFLSVFGGIVFFGPIGFLLGPLTVSLFFVLLHTYLSAPIEHTLENDGF